MASGISKTNRNKQRKKKNNPPGDITVGWLQQATDPSRYSNYELLFNDSPFNFLLGVSMLQCLPTVSWSSIMLQSRIFHRWSWLFLTELKTTEKKQTKLCLWVWGSKAIMAFLWFLNIYPYILFLKNTIQHNEDRPQGGWGGGVGWGSVGVSGR